MRYIAKIENVNKMQDSDFSPDLFQYTKYNDYLYNTYG